MEVLLQDSHLPVCSEAHPLLELRSLRVLSFEDGGDMFLRNICVISQKRTSFLIEELFWIPDFNYSCDLKIQPACRENVFLKHPVYDVDFHCKMSLV
jgi:hypothetical protein